MYFSNFQEAKFAVSQSGGTGSFQILYNLVTVTLDEPYSSIQESPIFWGKTQNNPTFLKFILS